jgi:hypothetical protein
MTETQGPRPEQESEETAQAQGAARSTEEWKAIFWQIEQQVRREAARVVGTNEEAGWSEIGRETDEAARKRMAQVTGLAEESGWDEIGSHVEKDVRSGIARFVGATPEADWAAIGQSVEEKVRAFFNDAFGRKAPSAAPQKDEGTEEDLVDPWQ